MRRIAFVAVAVISCGIAFAQSPLNEAQILMGDHRAAVNLAQQAAAEENQEGYQQQMQMAMENLQKALILFEEGDVMNNGDAAAIRDFAAAHSAAGNSDTAAKALGRATELASHDAGLWLEYGEAMAELGPKSFLAAKEAFDASYEKASEPGMQANALAGSGALFFRNGYYDIAADQFHAALEIQPDLPRAKAGIAAIELRNGNVKAASDALESVTPLPPALEKESNLMLAKAVNGFWDGRLKYEDTAENHLAYARLLIQANYPSSAIAPLRRSAKLAPEGTRALNMLGLLLTGLGDNEEAAKVLAQSLAIDSDQPRIAEFIQTIQQAGAPQTTPQSSLPVGIAAPPQQ